MIADFKLLNNAGVLSERKLVIWGAGINGRRMIRAIKFYVKEIEFVDADEAKAGKLVEGIPVCPIGKLSEYQKSGVEYAIAMSTNALAVQESILRQIEEMNIKETDVFTWYAVQAALYAMRRSGNMSALPGGEYAGHTGTNGQENIEVCNDETELTGYRQKLLGEMLFASVMDKAVWVYQDKKVGSQTIVKSAKAMGIYAVHVHSFNLLKYERFEFGDAFIKKMIQKTSGKVISLVREPIARQISLLWQNFGVNAAGALRGCRSWKEWEEKFYRIPNEEDEFEWYLSEFLRILDINVYEHPFDREKGYSIINQDGISVLLLKMEKIDDLETVIGAFLGEENFKIIRNNIGRDKKYKYAYQNYLEHVKIPRGFYEHYYKDNAHMDYFYTEEEKKAFSKRWENHIKD